MFQNRLNRSVDLPPFDDIKNAVSKNRLQNIHDIQDTKSQESYTNVFLRIYFLNSLDNFIQRVHDGQEVKSAHLKHF